MRDAWTRLRLFAEVDTTVGKQIEHECTAVRDGRAMRAPAGIHKPAGSTPVKARVAILETVVGEIVLRCPRNLPLFAGIDGLERAAEAGLRARLDLDEDDHAAVERDQVELASLTAVVPLHDRVALAPQEFLRGALAVRTKKLPFTRHELRQ